MIYLGYIRKCLFHQEISFVLLQLNNNMIVSPNKGIHYDYFYQFYLSPTYLITFRSFGF